jgi:hypothetical protein
VSPFAAGCPVDDRERAWIEESMAWFRGQFGADPLSQPVVLPTKEFFPPPPPASEADVTGLVRKIAGYMGSPQAEIQVQFTDDYDHAAAQAKLIPGAFRSYQGAAGAYREHGGRAVVTIDRAELRDPARLLAVIAHEIGHVRLLGEGRIGQDRQDGEPLTDLATVYLGMGIFTANAAFSFQHSAPMARTGGWSTRRLGYLTEQMFGYGLACYAFMRNEPDPSWVKYLDANPHGYCQRGLRYLRHAGAAGLQP